MSCLHTDVSGIVPASYGIQIYQIDIVAMLYVYSVVKLYVSSSRHASQLAKSIDDAFRVLPCLRHQSDNVTCYVRDAP